jgi:hypothetical protein
VFIFDALKKSGLIAQEIVPPIQRRVAQLLTRTKFDDAVEILSVFNRFCTIGPKFSDFAR